MKLFRKKISKFLNRQSIIGNVSSANSFFCRNLNFERVPKPFDLIRISTDRYNCSYVLEQGF
ncbi:hypothetical protein LEP1GSC043_0799 [Leptospira weilii str. Ecochallenge]|uniref:Uncharacterized protein n=1 Tax=Leptospira weilii str. Ecochallenge TaxID=1049986 RepID=N1UF67_9LEPT|nr:hypothetical protein LEP1GSC051_2419 [Leptospira sp. P2653]EMY16574.1 hypothetical protein LEP1GSC043_0799 [Leptospira weilii str. Ecochallenge]